MNSKKRIAVFAYTNNNVGDDIFVYMLLDRYPNVDFIFYNTARSLKFLKSRKNYTTQNRLFWAFKKIINVLFDRSYIDKFINSDLPNNLAVVKIGGSIFIDNGVPYKERYFNNSNTFYIGANYGPEKSLDFRKKVEKELRSITDICFRDKYSFELFNHLSNVRYAPDLLFSYKLPQKPVKEKLIGISVIDPELKGRDLSISREDYIEILNEFVNYAYSKGYCCRALGFCAKEQDNVIVNKIENAERYVYSGKLEDFLASFMECEFVIGTRFHATILGWNAEKKVLPVVYSNKMQNVLSDLKYDGPTWDLSAADCNDGREVFDALMRCTVLPNVNSLRIAADAHFKALDGFLGFGK